MCRFPLLKSTALISATTTIALTAALARSEDDQVMAARRVAITSVPLRVHVPSAAAKQRLLNGIAAVIAESC